MSPEPQESPTETTQAQPTSGVRLRTLIVAVIVSSLVSIGALDTICCHCYFARSLNYKS